MGASLLTAGLLLLLILLVAASGFFSGAEISIMSANKIRFRKNAERGDARAKRVLRAIESPEKTLTTILIGNNVVNISASAIATFLAVRAFGDVGVAIATGVMTLIILTFGEIIPKLLGAKHSEYVALRVAGPLEALGFFLSPLVRFFSLLTNGIILRVLGNRPHSRGPFITEDEIKMLARIGESEGVFEEHERDIIHKLFEFTDKRALDVMRPKEEIVAVDAGEPLAKAVSIFRKRGYSRMPVYKQSFDNIIGTISVKDILRFEQDELARMKVEALVKPVIIVNEKKMVPYVLEEMQSRGIHIAVALDDNRKVSGILSIADLLEELVGDLHSELDGEAYPEGG